MLINMVTNLCRHKENNYKILPVKPFEKLIIATRELLSWELKLGWRNKKSEKLDAFILKDENTEN